MRKDIIVISGKGGVGKTIVSVLLANELSKRGKTAIVDLDIDSANVTSYFGIDGLKITDLTEDRRVKPAVYNGIEINSITLLSEDTSISHYGSQYQYIVRELLENTAWSDDLLYLVADMPPSSSDVFRQTVELMKGNGTFLGAVVVSQPNTIEDLSRIYEICKRLYIPIIGFIENMSGCEMHSHRVVCEHCSEEFIPFGKGTVKKFAESVGGIFLGRIPLSYEIASDPLNVEGAASITIKKCADRIQKMQHQQIPRDKVRDLEGNPPFVFNVMKALFSAILRAPPEISELREKYGRRTNRGFFRLVIEDTPQTLSQFKTIYVGFDDRNRPILLREDKKPDNIIGTVRVTSGILASALRRKIPVMNPFTLEVVEEEYTFAKALNCGDIYIEGDRALIELFLVDFLQRRLHGG